jgi:hypothetical protein
MPVPVRAEKTETNVFDRDRVPGFWGPTSAAKWATTMKRILAMSVTIGMLTGPAYSQMNMNSGHKTPLQLKYEKEELDKKESERTYNEQMKRLRSQAPTPSQNDPWAGVRPKPETNSRR